LLADLCSTIPQPKQEGRGRPRLPLSDMVFASVYKVYVGFSARRFTSDLRDAFVEGRINTTPHFNSVNRYLSDPQLTDVLKELITVSSLPLKTVETDFAVDSSGFSTCRYVRWFNRKYGREVDNREWVKCHLMCGVNTRIVSAVDVSGWTANDTNYFVPLVERTAAHFGIREVSADKAYLSKKNLEAVEALGGDALRPIQVQHTRAHQGRDVGEDVPLVCVREGCLHGALPQAKQHRDSVQHDKGQVRKRPTKQERCRTD
jgi:hypothetical protein